MPRRPLAVPLSLAFLAACALAPGRARAEEGKCNRWDLEVSCATSAPRIILGQEFSATVTVKNSGDTALLNVTLQLRGDQGAPCVSGPGAVLKLVIEKFEPGDSKQVTGRFLPENMGTARVLGSARDSLGWAVSNCACTVEVAGLPAIHSDMSDRDISGAEKGIFKVGEPFLYVLTIGNQQGTAVTPDLRVLFTLPKELQFVSGKADNGVTVTGSGQGASTSGFVLAPPKGEVRIEITVKAVALPPTQLVKARASIQTASGVELASETESTTIR